MNERPLIVHVLYRLDTGGMEHMLVTLINQTHAPDDVYEELRKHFNETETANLTSLIGVINTWNRIAIGLRYQHPVKVKAA